MERRRRIRLVVGGTGVVVLLVTLGFALNAFIESGVTRPIDNMFGDQHLKTTVALVELHRVRYGGYPSHISDLRYTGGWDQIALNAVTYCANADGTAYFVEVDRGWAGRPHLKMQEGFWRGTGFDPNLGPCK